MWVSETPRECQFDLALRQELLNALFFRHIACTLGMHPVSSGLALADASHPTFDPAQHRLYGNARHVV